MAPLSRARLSVEAEPFGVTGASPDRNAADLPLRTDEVVHLGRMIAEVANYQSWIGWVPFVGLLALPLAVRRVLAVSLALVGAFVGFVGICLTMPFGTNAEQLGANVALGLGVGAALGALIGLAIDARRSGSRPPDASVFVVGFPLGLGAVGALVGGFAPSLLTGTPSDLELSVIVTVAIGGGIGWAIGTAFGWHRARHAPLPSANQRWLLLIAAFSAALFGAAVVATIAAGSFGPPIDSMRRAERDLLPFVAALYSVDVALIVSTFIAAAARGAGMQSQPVTAESVPAR
jgi:MFS family permease